MVSACVGMLSYANDLLTDLRGEGKIFLFPACGDVTSEKGISPADQPLSGREFAATVAWCVPDRVRGLSCFLLDAVMSLSTLSPLVSSAPRLRPSVSFALSRHLLAEQARAVMSARDALNEALIAVANLETAFNAGRIDRTSRDHRQAELRLDALLDAVLRAEAEQLVLEEVFSRSASYAIDRVIAYHVRRGLAYAGVLTADPGCRDALLALSQSVRTYLEEDPSDRQDMRVRSAWADLRCHIQPVRAG